MKPFLKAGLFFFIAGYFLSAALNFSEAASKIEDLKNKIDEKNKEMEQITKDIKEFSEKIDKTEAEAATLKNQIKKIDNNILKLRAEMRLSQNRINAAELKISELLLNIEEFEQRIKKNKNFMAESMRLIDERESNTLVEIMLGYESISDFSEGLEDIKDFENRLSVELLDLKDAKKLLEEEKNNRESEKGRLGALKEKLEDQHNVEKSVKNSKEVFLKETKNKEAQYKKILEDRLEKKEALEDEIRKFEQELKVVIDPSSLPSSGSGVLAWPLDNIRITQYFGNTPFATQNPQIYSGMGHNGVDFGASVGTPVKAAKEGIVIGTGNTDNECRGVSYGRWILIEHPNNISTLYAHLSLIKVQTGESVQSGQVIGYTGNSGYTTGPHLHFATFASRAVAISTMRSKICGTMMVLPLAPFNAYLNPLSYL